MEYTLKLSHIFEEQYIEFRNSGKVKVLEKINKLILELSVSPRKGTGKPERLKDVDKIDPTLDPQEIHIWSRRITDENSKNNLSASLSRRAASLPKIPRFGALGKEETGKEREPR